MLNCFLISSFTDSFRAFTEIHETFFLFCCMIYMYINQQEIFMNKQLIKPLITGGILILIGFVFLFDEFDWIQAGNILRLWPFILVIIGIGKIAATQTNHERIKASWWIFLGLWLYVSMQHVFGLSFSVTWPFILIFWGLTIVAKELLPVNSLQPESEPTYE